MKLTGIIKGEIREIIYLFSNYIVTYIPLWYVRKLLYRALGMKIGRGSRIMMGVKIYAPHKISIGNNTFINEFCYLDGRGGLTIGNNVTIATCAKIVTGSHNIDSEMFEYVSAPVTIYDNVAVFSDSIVLGGVELKKGVIISAKSLVRKGIYSENGVYGGNPAKYIRERKCSSTYSQEPVRLLMR